MPVIRATLRVEEEGEEREAVRREEEEFVVVGVMLELGSVIIRKDQGDVPILEVERRGCVVKIVY